MGSLLTSDNNLDYPDSVYDNIKNKLA